MNSSSTTPAVFAIATMDTKADEILWVASCLRSVGISVCVVDVSTQNMTSGQADVLSESVLAASGTTFQELQQLDRGGAVTCMTNALRIWLLQQFSKGIVQGVIGIGGSGGTAIISGAMRSLPVGLPKLMVSTVASGNTSPYVDCSDICLMPSVVDVAGLNSVSCRILGNAAHAMAGMVRWDLPANATKPAIGLTMFGVTTTCVTRVRQKLEQQGFDCLVFHATGTGGRSMEKLVESGLIQGVLDITTTEVADEIAGGVFPCGADRFDAILKKQIPFVLSVGALDMVNFGARETVPEHYRDRKLHVHNAHVTLMRTTAEENRRAAEWIAKKLNRSESPVSVVFPEHGVSAIDRAGQPFFDPEADGVLFSSLQASLHQTASRRLLRLPMHINDDAFADALTAEFLRQTQLLKGGQ